MICAPPHNIFGPLNREELEGHVVRNVEENFIKGFGGNT